MTKENVVHFIRYMEENGSSASCFKTDPEPADIISHAEADGFSFTEEDLKSVLNMRICNAESLPRPWGWTLARKFGLVRS